MVHRDFGNLVFAFCLFNIEITGRRHSPHKRTCRELRILGKSQFAPFRYIILCNSSCHICFGDNGFLVGGCYIPVGDRFQHILFEILGAGVPFSGGNIGCKIIPIGQGVSIFVIQRICGDTLIIEIHEGIFDEKSFFLRSFAKHVIDGQTGY